MLGHPRCLVDGGEPAYNQSLPVHEMRIGGASALLYWKRPLPCPLVHSLRPNKAPEELMIVHVLFARTLQYRNHLSAYLLRRDRKEGKNPTRPAYPHIAHCLPAVSESKAEKSEKKGRSPNLSVVRVGCAHLHVVFLWYVVV